MDIQSVSSPCAKQLLRRELAQVGASPSPMALAWQIRRDAADHWQCALMAIDFAGCMVMGWQAFKAGGGVRVKVLPAQETPTRQSVRPKGKVYSRVPRYTHDSRAGTDQAKPLRNASARWREVGKREKRVVMMQNTANVPWYEGEPKSTRGIGTDTAEFITSLERKTAWGKEFTAQGGSGGSYKPVVEMPTTSVKIRRAINNLN